MGDEEIVLLDQAGAAIGTAPKAASHHRDTPYHLAFSCYLVDGDGRVLITQRAQHKATWPSVWTNSCCGHPAPGEGLREAVLRRLRDELGVAAKGLTLLLPGFSYRAEMDNGVVEYERCPVVRAVYSGPGPDSPAGAVRPNPAEVAEARWWTWQECLDLAGRPEASPWYRLQLAELAPLGSPLDWPEASPSLLPPALDW
jgi:isopentenyl-diphosphate delta-isomerase